MSIAPPRVESETGSAWYVYLVSIVAATSGLLFGFDIAVINGALIFLREQFQLAEAQTEFAASALLIGCVFGASLAGMLSDRFGRRKVLIFSAVMFAVSSIGAAIPRTLTEFVVARFAGGLAIGVASVLAPLYIAEVSPARIRGRLVSLNQMTIVSGILLAYLINWSLSFLGPSSWRWMFAVAAIPSFAFFVALFFVPESPRWLVERGCEDEARGVLLKVGGRVEADLAMREIKEVIAEESGTFSELFEPRFRKPLIIAIALAILQQVTGINTVLFYGSIIFKEQVGSSSSSALGANVLIGGINVLSTIVALWLIDRVGRRPLLIFSAVCMGLCEIGLALGFQIQPPPGYLIIGTMLLCAGSFAVGLGPGVWVVLAEIFPTRVRGRAMGIATVALWIACVVLTSTFLTLVKTIGISGAFCIYAAMCATTVLVVWKWTPETKGRTLEQIEKIWH
jgi:sugar porter (SP) family MFS transporter